MPIYLYYFIVVSLGVLTRSYKSCVVVYKERWNAQSWALGQAVLVVNLEFSTSVVEHTQADCLIIKQWQFKTK